MNNTYKFLNNLERNAEKSFFGAEFSKNLDRFQFIANERLSLGKVIALEDFLNSFPEYLVDTSEDESYLFSLYSIAQENGKLRTAKIAALEEGDISIQLDFSHVGKLQNIKLSNDNIRLTLGSNSDVVTLEMGKQKIKLINLLKDHFCLNTVNEKGEEAFVASFEKEHLDNKIKGETYLFG